MSNLKLKQLQQYRGTFFLIIVLGVIAISLILLWSYNASQKKIATAPSIAPREINPAKNPIKWEDLSLGLSETQIRESAEGREPSSYTSNNGYLKMTYSLSENTTAQHEFWLKDNKIVRIIRIIDPTSEALNISYYDSQYNNPEQISDKQYTNEDIYPLKGFHNNDKEFLIIQYEKTRGQVFSVIITTKEEYEKVKSQYVQRTVEPHTGFSLD